jgi:hypothetical protein
MRAPPFYRFFDFGLDAPIGHPRDVFLTFPMQIAILCA